MWLKQPQKGRMVCPGLPHKTNTTSGPSRAAAGSAYLGPGLELLLTGHGRGTAAPAARAWGSRAMPRAGRAAPAARARGTGLTGTAADRPGDAGPAREPLRPHGAFPCGGERGRPCPSPAALPGTSARRRGSTDGARPP